MSRFTSPRSLQAGVVVGWYKGIESKEGYLNYKVFADYVNYLCYEHLTKKFGIVTGDLEIEYNIEQVKLIITFYDRKLEKSLKENEGSSRLSELIIDNALGVECSIIKRLITIEGQKYFNYPVAIEFKGVEMRGIPAILLARYITLCMEQGYSLKEIMKLVEKELRGIPSINKEKKTGIMSHRPVSMSPEGKGIFKPYNIKGTTFLGFRIDCVGRYSRRQRGSKNTLSIGRVPVGSYKGYLDYGSSIAILTYGVSNVRVWLYYEKGKEQDTYLCKIK
jgi:hypothetical protein